MEYKNVKVPWKGQTTVGDWVTELRKLSPQDQKVMVDDWMMALTNFFDVTANVICAAGTEFQKMTPLMNEYGGTKEFQERYPLLKNVQQYKEKRQKESTAAFSTIKGLEAQVFNQVFLPYSSSVLYSHEGITSMQWCLIRFNIVELVPWLNTRLYIRRNNARRKKDAYVNSSDWSEVHDLLRILPAEFAKYAANNTMLQGIARQHSMTAEEVRRGISKRQDPAHKFWLAALSWYSTFYDKNNQPQVVATIPVVWLKERKMKFHPCGLIIPDNVEIGTSLGPMTIEQASAASGFLLERLGTPGSRFSSPERPYQISSPGNGMRNRSSLVPQAEKLISESHRRSRSVSTALEGASIDDSPESRRRAGIEVVEQSHKVLDSFLESQKPKKADAILPLAGGRILRTRAQAKIYAELREESPGLAQDIDQGRDIAEVEEDEIQPDVRFAVKQGGLCSCKNQDSALLMKIRSHASSSKTLKDPERIALLTEWYRECVDNSTVKDSRGRRAMDTQRVCFAHMKFTVGKLGMKTRTLTGAKMYELLKVLYHKRSELGKFQSDAIAQTLFVARHQGNRTNDDLLSYRYRPARIVVKPNWKGLATAMNMDNSIKEFKQTGSIILPIFSWIFDNKELVKILDESFDMYDFHTRTIDGKNNLGWCRVMYHSLIQQLVRGDIGYWLAYAILREETNLISYPYYTKYTKPGDRTFFRHIDLNISEAVYSRHGVDTIQGSVSFDQEDDENCTELLMGFHNIIDKYQDWRVENGKGDSTGYIEGWTDKYDWPQNAQDRFPQVKWKKQPCKAGEVRISSPCLPHGSTGPATRRRRTILPWLVKVQDDMATMEMPEMGSYQEIALAHQSLTAAPLTPSGHPNKYGGIKWAFPADVSPEFSSAISKAIHCQLRWDNPAVLAEMEKNLTGSVNSGDLWKWIKEHRANTVAMVKKHWAIAKTMERRAFCEDLAADTPDRSFFSNKGVNPRGGGEWWKYDGQIEQKTAIARWKEEEGTSAEERAVQEALLGSPSPSRSRAGDNTDLYDSPSASRARAPSTASQGLGSPRTREGTFSPRSPTAEPSTRSMAEVFGPPPVMGGRKSARIQEKGKQKGDKK